MNIVLYFHGGSLNRGCQALAFSAIKIIKEKYPNAQITLASFNSDSDFELKDFCKVVNASVVKLSLTSWSGVYSAFRVKFFKDESYYYQKVYKKLLDLIQNNDYFLSIGGDNYCYGEQPWLYEINKQIKKAGKKLVLWGGSIGEEDLSEAKITDLASYDLILARETLTKEVLEKAGLKNVSLCADGAFLLDKTILPFPTNWVENNTIGFNLSPLVAKRNTNALESAFQLLDHILESTSFSIALVPHVFVPGNDDAVYMQHILEKYKNNNRVFMLPSTLNALEIKGYIARLRMFIGARTHATIAAYSNFVPTLVLGYSIKSRGIAKDIFGTEKLVLKLSEWSDANKMIEAFEELKNEEADIRAFLQKRIPEIQEQSRKAAIELGKI